MMQQVGERHEEHEGHDGEQERHEPLITKVAQLNHRDGIDVGARLRGRWGFGRVDLKVLGLPKSHHRVQLGVLHFKDREEPRPALTDQGLLVPGQDRLVRRLATEVEHVLDEVVGSAGEAGQAGGPIRGKD